MATEGEAAAPAPIPAPVPASAPADPVTPARPRRRRVAWWLGGGFGALLALVCIGAAVIFWAVGSVSGTAWLLGIAPQLKVVAPQGSLIGDFAAERVDVSIPGTGTLRLDRPRWRALDASLGSRGRWLRLTIAALHADRVTWLPGPPPEQASGEPARPPATLRLPIEVLVGEASVDELRVGGDGVAGNAVAEGAPLLRGLRARVHLGADGGAKHTLDGLAGRIDRASARGSLSIGADAPFDVTAAITAQTEGTTPTATARIAARGPLERLAVDAAAEVAATATHPAQSAQAVAQVLPFAAWPVGALTASVVAFDLSAFASAAPATSLSGTAQIATGGMNVPAVVSLDVANARAGRWNEGLLPVTRVVGELRARPDDASVLEVHALTADLGSKARPGGRLAGSGRWAGDRWTLDADLSGVRPSALDARAPETALTGKVAASGSGFADAATRAVELKAQLAGALADPRLPRDAPRAARLVLDARATANRIDVRSADATLGEAKAALSGELARADERAPWKAAGKARLQQFDPTPWWPGAADSPLGRGANRLDAEATFDLQLPAFPLPESPYAITAATRGRAEAIVTDSLLGGVPFAGRATFANDDGAARPALQIVAAGNRLDAEGRIAAAGIGDDWRLVIDAPKLETLAAWAGPAVPASASTSASASASPRIAGTLTVKAHVAGRWPDVTSDGELQAANLRAAGVSVRTAAGRWRVGSAGDTALDGTLTADGVAIDGRAVEHAEARLTGTARAHRAELRVDSAALPPEWADALAARGAITSAAAAPASASSAAVSVSVSAVASATPPSTLPTAARSRIAVVAEGGLVDIGGERAAGWRGTLRELAAASVTGPARIWLRARDLRGSVSWAGGPARASLEPGSIEALGATLRWTRAQWQQGAAQGGGNAPPRVDVQAAVDTFPVAPALRTLQPDFGWGGDLAVGARIDVRSTPQVKVDVVLERSGGDLTVTDEYGTQKLGVTDLRLGVAADQGVWHFTAAVAGSTLGVASAAVTARTSSSASWPEARTPLEGVVELRVANLGTWGTWVPAGWRLAGELHASASIGGRFGAPEYTGRVEGTKLGVRNFVEGVNVTDGDVAIALRGNTARIERFSAKGGAGTVRLEGEASFDESPAARLRLVAERFQLLGRVDRRIVASGDGALRLDAKTLDLTGTFAVDEGLVDFTRGDAPSLGSDVVVVRRPAGAPAPPPAAAPAPPPAPASAASAAESSPVLAAAPAAAASAATPLAPRTPRAVQLDLRVDMGKKLRIRGRGLDAELRGELHITSPGSRIAVNGTLRAVDGTYQAYGQKLGIDRAVLVFTGRVENPRLDIEATRPDLDIRVGVTVTGTALIPRIRLFSEPEMADLDKLSWLVLGRAPETAGGADAALLQQAALALLAGEGPGVTDRLIKSVGLDSVSVRQQSQGAVKDTIVSLGKQISKNWYVGYERGLNTTNGTWQLIYRLAQRVTVRAEAGGDNAVDVIWTLRWK